MRPIGVGNIAHGRVCGSGTVQHGWARRPVEIGAAYCRRSGGSRAVPLQDSSRVGARRDHPGEARVPWRVYTGSESRRHFNSRDCRGRRRPAMDGTVPAWAVALHGRTGLPGARVLENHPTEDPGSTPAYDACGGGQVRKGVSSEVGRGGGTGTAWNGSPACHCGGRWTATRVCQPKKGRAGDQASVASYVAVSIA
jgi:hypothetical protein